MHHQNRMEAGDFPVAEAFSDNIRAALQLFANAAGAQISGFAAFVFYAVYARAAANIAQEQFQSQRFPLYPSLSQILSTQNTSGDFNSSALHISGVRQFTFCKLRGENIFNHLHRRPEAQ